MSTGVFPEELRVGDGVRYRCGRTAGLFGGFVCSLERAAQHSQTVLLVRNTGQQLTVLRSQPLALLPQLATLRCQPLGLSHGLLVLALQLLVGCSQAVLRLGPIAVTLEQLGGGVHELLLRSVLSRAQCLSVSTAASTYG